MPLAQPAPSSGSATKIVSRLNHLIPFKFWSMLCSEHIRIVYLLLTFDQILYILHI